MRTGGGATVAVRRGCNGGCRAVAGHRRDDPGIVVDDAVRDTKRDFTDAMVALIRNVEVAGSVQGQSHRNIYLGAGGGTTVARKTPRSGSGHRGNQARRCRHSGDFVYATITRKKEITPFIHDDATGGVYRFVDRDAIFGIRTGGSGSGYHRHHPVSIHFAHTVIVTIRDVQVADRVKRYTKNVIEVGIRGVDDAAVAVVATPVVTRPGAGHGRDHAGARGNLTDAVIVVFRNVHVAHIVHG